MLGDGILKGMAETAAEHDGGCLGELVKQAAYYTGITEKAALVREALTRLVRNEAARRLAALGGSDPEAEAALRGQAATQATFERAAEVLLRSAKGFAHNTFKIDLARRAIVRALTQAARGTPQSQSDKKIR